MGPGIDSADQKVSTGSPTSSMVSRRELGDRLPSKSHRGCDAWAVSGASTDVIAVAMDRIAPRGETPPTSASEHSVGINLGVKHLPTAPGSDAAGQIFNFAILSHQGAFLMAHRCSVYPWALLALILNLLLSSTACSTNQADSTQDTRPDGEPSATSQDTKNALELTPWTANILFVLDVRELREKADIHSALHESFANSLRNAIDKRFNTDEINSEEVDRFIYAASSAGYDSGAVLLQGDFHLDDIRRNWQDEGYNDRTYRSEEIWAGRDTYAIVERHRSVIASSHETLVKDFVRVHDGTITSLHRLRDAPYAQLLAVLRDAPMYFASGYNADCANRFVGCQAFGIRYESTVPDQSTIHLTVVLVLPDLPAAEAAAEERTDAVDTVTHILNANTSWAMEILGLPISREVELGNMRTEDNVLFIEAAMPLEASP